MLSIFLGSRILSHYAASSSTSVLTASVETAASTNGNVVNMLGRHSLWRSLSQAAGSPLDANGVVQAEHQPGPQPSAPSRGSADLTPSGSKAGAEVASGAQGRSTNAGPTAPTARWRRLQQQLTVPPNVLQELRPPVQPYQLTPLLAQRPTGAPAQYTPWTPTRALQRRKHVSKRMGFLMQVLEREQAERVRRARPLPDFRAGDVLEVRMMLPEAERKVTIYRGVCIARYTKGIRSSFKIYNVYPECGGVVQHIPLYMPDLLGIKVVGRIPASQERLFYLLDRETSDYTFQTGVSAAN
ncbi:hypothetical protein PLESTB_000363700 [Pleodorina starrii]|uniref:Ribosomal protein L19 n=1 Tax=Pleodorina starrii TaxID=330485 RepID=A0A9W6EZN2_9CHLO|nr:hypothetical protein PLESTM_000031500 [Pleodorina starrii]GLC50296.1 hypothetical protein PLESTB_000363700 [Pleodorina starrii]GLC64320.1 hypothetical protein PLESTF_000148900 [Pleodorina starrii]